MKQFVMNALKIWEPKKKGKIEDKFKAHKIRMEQHFPKFADEYKTNEDRKEHENAER